MGATIICRRSAFSGFDPELYQFADHFVDLVVSSKYGACFIPETLATWRVMGSGYSETAFKDLERTLVTIEMCAERGNEKSSLYKPESLLIKPQPINANGLTAPCLENAFTSTKAGRAHFSMNQRQEPGIHFPFQTMALK